MHMGRKARSEKNGVLEGTDSQTEKICNSGGYSFSGAAARNHHKLSD